MRKLILIFSLFIGLAVSESLVKVVYTSSDSTNGLYGLAIVDIDGTNKTYLSNNDFNEGGHLNVDVSNDGKKIVFASDNGSDSQIIIMDIDGSNRIELTDFNGSPRYAHFTPNGDQIYFTSCPFNCNLVVMDTSGVIQDTIFEGGDWGFYDSFNSDGTKILYTDELANDNSREVYMMDLDDGSTIKLTDNNFNDHSPMFIPYDNSKILFTRSGSGLYKMDINNSNEELITDFEPGRQLDFSNDIYTIILSSIGDGNQLYLTNLDGSDITALTNDNYQYKNQKFVQYGGQEKIVYVSNPSTWEIFIMDLDGSNSVSISNGNGRYPHIVYTVYEGPVWHVATTGSDQTGDGTEANPFATISAARNMTGDGDTILVAPGEYDFDFIDFNTNYSYNQTIMSSDGAESTIISSTQLFFIFNDSTIVIDGFTFANYISSGGEDAPLLIWNGSPTIKNCIFRNNTSSSHASTISINGPATKPKIINCLFYDNVAFEEYGTVYISNEANPLISNCTFYNNVGGALFILSVDVIESPIIKNSIFWHNTGQAEYEICGPAIVTYSNIEVSFDGDDGSQEDMEGNINADPLFCNPDSGDFTLAENSPCVGTGENGANMGAFGIGCDAIILSISDELLPVTYTLHQNYPNPFNPVTTLRYDLPENALVNITIYDMLGRQVKTLMDQTQNAGYRSIIWDATNDYGKPVSAGLYLYQIQAGEYISTKKMVLLK